LSKSFVLLALMVALVLSAHAGAQLSAEVAQNPIPQGQLVKLNISASLPATLRLACPLDVRQGSPNGPVVWTVGPCILLLVNVGPGISYGNMAWPGTDNSNQPVAPGTYYIRIGWRPQSSSQPWIDHFVPVRIDPKTGPTDPILSTTTTAARGQALNMNLIAPPQNAGNTYIAAAAFTTNTGFSIAPFEHIAVDPDPLLFLSLIQLPPIFSNFSGNLDKNAQANPSMFIPNISSLQGAQIAVQALVVDSQNMRHYSNPITRIIN